MDIGCLGEKALAIDQLDIESICQEYSEQEQPPEVFLLSRVPWGHLVGVNASFLEEGQKLPWPGLALAGATFDPDWGFSRAEVGIDDEGQPRMQLPEVHHDHLNNGNTRGYRLCVVEPEEIPLIIAQLASIRSALAARDSEAHRPVQHDTVLVTL